MADKMKQESGDHSQNIQIAGDVHYGITVSEAFEISKSVIKQELAIYTKEAMQTVENRFEQIANKIIERINNERPDLLPKFTDPAIQIALNETYKKYIETGDEELGDNLIHIMIDRLEIENRDTKQFIIDDARVILPKLSVSNLSFLALHVFSMLSIPIINRAEYKTILEKLKKITNNAGNITHLDIMYLKQSGCAMGTPMIHVNENIAGSLLKKYEYYFSDGISFDSFAELAIRHQLNRKQGLFMNASLLSDMLVNNYVGMRFPSKARFENFFTQNNLPEIKAFFEEFISMQNKADINDVKSFHKSIDINWNEVFSLWDKEIVTTLSIMPVGLYIGSIYLGRILGLKVPQDIFYK